MSAWYSLLYHGDEEPERSGLVDFQHAPVDECEYCLVYLELSYLTRGLSLIPPFRYFVYSTH